MGSECIQSRWSSVLHAEVVNNKSELDRVGLVGEQARSERSWKISSLLEMCYKVVVRKLTGLREAIHALDYFGVYFVVGHHGFQVVVLNDVGGNDIVRNHQIFWFREVCLEIKIFDINGSKSGAGCGEHTVN